MYLTIIAALLLVVATTLICKICNWRFNHLFVRSYQQHMPFKLNQDYSNAIVSNYSYILNAISTNPLQISSKLLEKGIISEETEEKILYDTQMPTRMAKILLNAVLKQVKIEPEKGLQFLQVLEQFETTSAVAKHVYYTHLNYSPAMRTT